MTKKAVVVLVLGLVALGAVIAWLLAGGSPQQQMARAPGEAEAARQGAPSPAGARQGELGVGLMDPGSAVRRGGAGRARVLVPAVAQPDAAARAGIIEGRVLDYASGEGVANAELSLGRDNAVVATLTTDRDGDFRFEADRPGPVHVAAVTAEGYLPYAPEWGQSPLVLEPRAEWHVSAVIIYLTPAIDYTGVVTDQGGAPVGDAEVRIIDARSDEQELMTSPRRFSSDARGQFVFHAPDGALLEARKAGYAPGRAALDEAAQINHRLTIRLGPARDAKETLGTESITGVVVEESGVALSGVRVQATPAAASDREGLRAGGAATSGEEGRFAIAGLDPGAYDMLAVDGLHAPATARANAGVHDLRLVLHTGAMLRGRVLTPERTAVASATVAVAKRKGLAAELVKEQSVVDPLGEFRVLGLEPGAYELFASAYGFAPSAPVSARAAVAVDETEAVEIMLSRGGAVAGIVRARDGKPLEHARVTMESNEAPQGASVMPAAPSVVTDAQGRFLLGGLPPGRRSVYIAAAMHNPRIISGLDVAEGTQLGPLDVVLNPVAEGESPRLELAGIGAMLAASDNRLRIGATIAGGGALEAGLKSGDEIIMVDGRPVVELGFDGAVQAIRGPEGTQVRLSIRRAGASETEDVWVFRRNIQN
jgi:hypothetical protein